MHERNKRNLDLKYLRVVEIGILVSTFVQQMIEFLISKIMELLKKYLRNVCVLRIDIIKKEKRERI